MVPDAYSACHRLRLTLRRHGHKFVAIGTAKAANPELHHKVSAWEVCDAAGPYYITFR